MAVLPLKCKYNFFNLQYSLNPNKKMLNSSMDEFNKTPKINIVDDERDIIHLLQKVYFTKYTPYRYQYVYIYTI